jgi:hypothetical protein
MLALVEDSGPTWSAALDLALGCAVQWLFTGGSSAFDASPQASWTVRVVSQFSRFLFGVVVFSTFVFAGGTLALGAGHRLAAVLPDAIPVVPAVCFAVAIVCLAIASLRANYSMSLRRMTRYWDLLKVNPSERTLIATSLLAFPVPSLPALAPSEVAGVVLPNFTGLALWRCGLTLLVGDTGVDLVSVAFLATFGWLGLCVCYRGLARPGTTK